MPQDLEEMKSSPAANERRQQAAAYEGAMEAIFAIVIATGAGYWADGYFDSSPFGVLIGAAIGFAAFVLRILRMRPKDEDVAAGQAAASSKADEESRDGL